MKKGIFLGILVIIAALATFAGAGAYYMGSLQRGNAFLQGSVVNGKDVSGQTPAQVTAGYASEVAAGEVVLMEDGKEIFRATLPELGYALDEEAFEASLTGFMESEKTDRDTLMQSLVNGNEFSLDIPFTFSEDTYKKAVTKKAFTAKRKENTNAKIVYSDEEGKCIIQPEVQGTKLHDKDLREWLKKEIDVVFVTKTDPDGKASAQSGNTSEEQTPAAPPSDGEKAEQKKADAAPEGEKEKQKSADAASEGKKAEADSAAAAQPGDKTEGYSIVRTIPSSLYIVPELTASNKRLQKKCSMLNEYADETITYVFGSVTETLDFKDFMNWIKIKGDEVTLRQEKVTEYVSGLAEKYNTRYRDRVFTTSGGGEVTFPAGLNEYGYTILEESEAAQLTQDILSGQSVEREPIYLTNNDWGDPCYLSRNGQDDLNGTYVEVSIGAQHMWYYLNGALFLESDVVTGDVTLDQGTASGVFPLAFKESPATLKGGEGKKKYTTKVQYWMPFYDGQGLHDAWWKTVFGGEEYKGNGSHGCVNLPSSVAETLYNNIVPGTPIVIYN